MKSIFLSQILLLSSCYAFSQKLFFAKENYVDSVSMQKNIGNLARQTLARYTSANTSEYLDNTFRLQQVAGLYSEANTTLSKLCTYELKDSLMNAALGFPYQLYNDVLAQGATTGNFEAICTATFLTKYNHYNDENKVWVSQYFDNTITDMQLKLSALIAKYKTSDSLSTQEALLLCRAYLSYNTYSSVLPIAKKILAKIEADKYVVDDSILLKMPDGGTIAVTVVRARNNTKPLPVVMLYNIYAGREVAECKDAVSHGYVGVVANTRGKRLSTDAIEPFEHDAKDAYSIIDWISKQPWCNGKVGMYGGSYLGFSQWAATKYLHPALKTIVPQVSVGIGIDYPLHNGVFMNYALSWIHFVTDNKLVEATGFTDDAKWNKVYGDWYKSGKSFRSLDTIEGRPNKIFQRWLQHPNYDSFWQNMIPQKEAFSKINIPIFTTTGYWDDDQTGALYYYKQYHQYNKNPNYYLLIGPYDHGGSQGFPKKILGNYTIDSVANIPILEYVFKWFDYTLKDSAKPAFLKDKVNFEIMGKNEWKGVAALSKMANDTLSLYITPKLTNKQYALSFTKPVSTSYIPQIVDLKDRSEQFFWKQGGMGAYPNLIDTAIICEKEKLIFVSDTITQPFAISGAIQAAIVACVNKKDMDIVIDVFEQTPDGKYFALNQNIQRASYANNRSKRKLLQPNAISTIPITNTFITCKQLQKGSRIVIVLGINKNPNWQINYGTGKDVSDETIKDAAEPMQLKWYNSSCIKIPILKSDSL